MSDLIRRLSELRCQYNCFDENERDAYHTLSEAIKALSDVPDTNVGDTISRQAAIDAIDETDWYHQNRNGEMVHGANSAEDQPWYKADDVYNALGSVPTVDAVEVVRCKDCKNSYVFEPWDGEDAPRYCRTLRNALARGSHLIVDDDDFCARGIRR